MTHAYRCYLLDEGHHIAAAEPSGAATFSGTGVWDRERRVSAAASAC